MKIASPQKLKWVFLSLILISVFVMLFSLYFGEETLSLSELMRPDSLDRHILLQVNLPRVLLSFIVGFALSSCGVAFQSLLRNPLADPYILGVSGGAALGSALAVALGVSFVLRGFFSFSGALSSLFLIYWIAQEYGRLPVYRLLLTGVIFNSFCFSIIIFLNTLLEFSQSHQIWYIMVGSLERQSYSEIVVVALFVFIGFFILWKNALPMNLLTLGDEAAEQLGLNSNRSRKAIFFAASLMVGITVSVSGLIGLLGLFIPHMARMVLGPDHRILLPGAALFGGAFLVLADWLARVVLSNAQWQSQFPVGVITALVGGPFFVYLLKRASRKGMWV